MIPKPNYALQIQTKTINKKKLAEKWKKGQKSIKKDIFAKWVFVFRGKWNGKRWSMQIFLSINIKMHNLNLSFSGFEIFLNSFF